jgi:hypothetical protein
LPGKNFQLQGGVLHPLFLKPSGMENVNAVKIVVQFSPGQSNGAIRVSVDSVDFDDAVIVLASALYRDARLLKLVKQAVFFMADPDFKEVTEKNGL